MFQPVWFDFRKIEVKPWKRTEKWTQSKSKYVNQSLVGDNAECDGVSHLHTYLKIDASDFQKFFESPCKNSPKIQVWKDKRSKVAKYVTCFVVVHLKSGHKDSATWRRTVFLNHQVGVLGGVGVDLICHKTLHVLGISNMSQIAKY